MFLDDKEKLKWGVLHKTRDLFGKTLFLFYQVDKYSLNWLKFFIGINWLKLKIANNSFGFSSI